MHKSASLLDQRPALGQDRLALATTGEPREDIFMHSCLYLPVGW